MKYDAFKREKLLAFAKSTCTKNIGHLPFNLVSASPYQEPDQCVALFTLGDFSRFTVSDVDIERLSLYFKFERSPIRLSS